MINIVNKYQKPILFMLLFGMLCAINPPFTYAYASVGDLSDEYIYEYEQVEEEKSINNILEIVESEKNGLAESFSNEYLPKEEETIIEEPTEEDTVIEEEIEIFRPVYYRTTANLRLRTGPSLDADIIRTVSSNGIVRVYDRLDGEWFSVYHNGTMGYMNAEFLEYIPDLDAFLEYLEELRSAIPAVELVDWWDARNTIIRTGVTLHITDVRTGITFNVRSFSNGNHADVETVTQADTDAMLRAYGGRWSWDTRPIWVTVDGRTFAASINGMPHAGSTISGNGMNGHVCIHFLNSRTHSGNRSHERDHQNSVQEAYRAGNR